MSDCGEINNLRERVQHLEAAMVEMCHKVENVLYAIKAEVEKMVNTDSETRDVNFHLDQLLKTANPNKKDD